MIIGQVVDKLPSVHLRRADPSLLDSDTLLGVEVEVEGCKKGLPTSNSSTGYWLSKEDHSLREGGREFVFAEPLFGADAVAAINYLCDEAIAQKWVISERTGIHVHMDMRNMEVEKFQNFCILYALTNDSFTDGWVRVETRTSTAYRGIWQMVISITSAKCSVIRKKPSP